MRIQKFRRPVLITDFAVTQLMQQSFYERSNATLIIGEVLVLYLGASPQLYLHSS